MGVGLVSCVDGCLIDSVFEIGEMMFIDGFVLPVPKGKVAEYTKMAKAARKVWMKHGALEYREFEFEEIDQQPMVSFLKMAKAKDEETVIFAWILYKSNEVLPNFRTSA